MRVCHARSGRAITHQVVASLGVGGVEILLGEAELHAAVAVDPLGRGVTLQRGASARAAHRGGAERDGRRDERASSHLVSCVRGRRACAGWKKREAFEGVGAGSERRAGESRGELEREGGRGDALGGVRGGTGVSVILNRSARTKVLRVFRNGVTKCPPAAESKDRQVSVTRLLRVRDRDLLECRDFGGSDGICSLARDLRTVGEWGATAQRASYCPSSRVPRRSGLSRPRSHARAPRTSPSETLPSPSARLFPRGLRARARPGRAARSRDEPERSLEKPSRFTMSAFAMSASAARPASPRRTSRRRTW